MPANYDPSVMKVPEPDYNNPWELYTFFGWAAAEAQALEKSLVILLCVLKTKAGSIVSPEEFQLIWQGTNSDPMGSLLRELKKYKPYDRKFEDLLYETKRKRDYLMHRFYFDAPDILNRANIPAAIEELRGISNQFQDLIPQVRAITVSIVDSYEVTESEINAKLRAYYRSL